MAPPIDPPLQCPHCHAALAPWEPPAPSRGEARVMWVASHVATGRFAMALLTAIACWVGVNVVWKPCEPHPVIVFAVLSAVLATVASLQGPLVLSAQRRAAERDRLRDLEMLRLVRHNAELIDRLAPGDDAHSA